MFTDVHEKNVCGLGGGGGPDSQEFLRAVADPERNLAPLACAFQLKSAPRDAYTGAPVTASAPNQAPSYPYTGVRD